MANYKVEIFLKGEFKEVDVFLEGTEIPLREINDNDYYKLYNQFDIQNPLDINVRLKGWYDMFWEFSVKVNDVEKYHKNGVFDNKGFVGFTDSVIV